FTILSDYAFIFFFSSRRRHTRFSRDWSSDVCSSDLARIGYPQRILLLFVTMAFHAFFGVALMTGDLLLAPDWFGLMGREWGPPEIGRASCRERVESAVEEVCVK